MLINIDIDVIREEANFRLLDRLLILFEKNQHEWYLTNEEQEIFQAGWPSQLSQSHQKILAEIVTKSYTNTAFISKKELEDREVFNVSTEGNNALKNAILIFEEPLFIVVENETSDSLFLDRLFEIYPKHGKALLEARKRNSLVYYPAGGRNETIKTIKNLRKRNPEPYKPRIFVFIDSDKKFPNQQHENKLQEIVDYCAEEQIPLHVLYKREIENYLPKEVLQKHIPHDLSEIGNEIYNLTPDQWDYYDLVDGFKSTPPKSDDPIYSEFSNRKNPRYNILRRGLHQRDLFMAKQILFTLVGDEEFNMINVDSRCSHQPDRNELLNLLARIKNKL